ncbi:MAG: hypothetical protein ACI8RZ_004031 [Myxococcota bacterium]
MKPWLRRHGPLLILLAITTLAYARLWWVGWSWDDEALILDNQVTGSLANIGEFFTRDLWATTRLESLKSGYYRPLFLLSLAMDRALFGLSSTAAHIHSLLWHLLVVGALYGFIRKLVTPAAAITAATLFALHPVNVEVLALVAARNDSMAAAMSLFAIWLVSDREFNAKKAAGAGLLFLGGLLSKESAVLAPVMLLVLDFARFKRPGDLKRYLPFVISAAIYLGLRSLAEINEGIMPGESSYALIVGRSTEIIALYGRLLVFPWPLSPARHVNYLPDIATNLPGLFLFGALVIAALVKSRLNALVVVGLLWAGLAFAPSLAATLDKGLLGERYLYFALAGLALSMAATFPHPPRWLAPAIAVPAIIVLQMRLPEWQDSRTVWEAAHRVSPSPFTGAGLGWYYHRDKELDKALPLLVLALEGDPPYRDVCDLIVSAHIEDKQPREAAEIAKWAIEERGCPPRGLIIDHYALALAGSGQWEEAVTIALSQPGGPQGMGIVVLAAAQARRGNLAAIRAGSYLNKDPEFAKRVAQLLKLGGEPQLAAKIMGG